MKKEGVTVTYASIEMIRFLAGLPPENTEDIYLSYFNEKAERLDPGAEISHRQAIKFYEHRKCFPKQ